MNHIQKELPPAGNLGDEIQFRSVGGQIVVQHIPRIFAALIECLQKIQNECRVIYRIAGIR
jgi:hypothetical protein